ncbi:MAG: hypothetical protein ACLFNZ_11270 [Spirochaetaceae bacterium]
MKNFIGPAIIFGVIGLIAGYFLFGKVAGSYIEIQALIMPSDSILGQIGNTIRGVEEVRRKVLVSGVTGAVIGVGAGFLRRR